MNPDSFEKLEKALGYHFRNCKLLAQALTHSSRKNDLLFCNERMEFFGDALLGAVVSEFLYRNLPDDTEGELTRVKSLVVSRPTLVRIAEQLNIEEYLNVAKGVAVSRQRKKAGRKKVLPKSLLSNAFEALIAAVYLDGGMRATRQFIMRHMRAEIDKASTSDRMHNYKSALQQYTQRELGIMPVYRVTSEEGPDHGKMFEVVTVLKRKRYGTGRGATKKDAEQEAARQTLIMLE